MEVVRKTGFADFAKFQATVVSLPLAFVGKVLRVLTIWAGKLTLHADRIVVAQVNERTVDLAPSWVFDSPFIQSKYDPGLVGIQTTTAI